MFYWRLHIQPPVGPEEVYDLRDLKRFSVGDDGNCDFAINSVKVPSKHILLKRRMGKLQLNLTDETKKSLKGKFQKQKNWKARLYRGEKYIVYGDCQWEIEGYRFSLKRIEKRKLAPLPVAVDPVARGHFYRSVVYSIAGHIGILLLFFMFGLISLWLKDRLEDPLEVQKLAIVDRNKVFPKPQPEPEPSPVEVEPKEAPESKAAKKSSKSTQNNIAKGKPKVASKSARQKGKRKARKKDVKNLGLLAIQTNASSKASPSVKVSSPPRPKKEAVVADAAGLGSPDAGFGVLEDSKSIAKLNNLSGESYTGDVGSQVKAKRGASIQLVRREVEVRGGLEPAVIRQIIEERLPEVRYCYEVALLKNQDLRGKINASWVINAEGNVTTLRSISNEIGQSILHPCLKKQIKNWKFPKPKGGGIVRVKYPFVFSPIGS